MDPVLFDIWLSFMGRPNYKISEMILSSCGGREGAWKLSEMRSVPDAIRVNKKLAERFTDASLREKAKHVYEMCMRIGMHISSVHAADYPSQLREVINRPGVIYYIGKLPRVAGISEHNLISVVGSRKCTAYGRTNAYTFSRSLAERGVGIVSGMARGIDSEAHRGALAAGGYTIAVLGGGADVVYPPENIKLYKAICESGCVISEYPPGTPPLKANFPARNRIISGLSSGTLVVEAARSSGAMITVDRAIEQNKNVYAIPGNITSDTSQGCNAVIRQGAICVTSYEDILSDMSIGESDTSDSKTDCGWIQGLNGAEAAAAAAVSKGRYSVNDIVRYADMSISDILSALTMLEIKGIVSKASDGTYRLMQ